MYDFRENIHFVPAYSPEEADAYVKTSASFFQFDKINTILGRQMIQYLDIDRWNRKAQFDFFRNYDNPFFNICTELEITELHRLIKERGISFFRASLFLSLKAINTIDEFRYRIRGDQVIIHDIVHAGSTVLNADDTFSFCYFNFFHEYREFDKHTADVLMKNQQKGGGLDPQDDRDDLIHFSVIPWISFTGISHPRRFPVADSIPKIVFGKYYNTSSSWKMPISIDVHHALMDGIQVAKFLEQFQDYINRAEEILKK